MRKALKGYAKFLTWQWCGISSASPLNMHSIMINTRLVLLPKGGVYLHNNHSGTLQNYLFIHKEENKNNQILLDNFLPKNQLEICSLSSRYWNQNMHSSKLKRK
jgi:hypothetical protein